MARYNTWLEIEQMKDAVRSMSQALMGLLGDYEHDHSKAIEELRKSIKSITAASNAEYEEWVKSIRETND